MMVQLAQQGPPNTAIYYHIAYTCTAVLYGGYAMLLWRRSQRVRARLAAMRGGDDRRA